LRNAVGNITIQTTPGLNAAFGDVVPVGGTLRQRQNVDLIHAEGVEAGLIWNPTENVSVTVQYLYTRPHIVRSTANPGLDGLDLAEVARNQGSLAVEWRPWQGATWRAEGQAQSGEFDDDQNTRRLAGYMVVNLFLQQAIGRGVAFYVRGDNVFDRTIEAGLSADGLFTIGTPRTITAGLRLTL
jgi:vitamin B12 transporter